MLFWLAGFLVLTVRKIPHFCCSHCWTVLFVLSYLGWCLMLHVHNFGWNSTLLLQPLLMCCCVCILYCHVWIDALQALHACNFGILHFCCSCCWTMYCCVWVLYCHVWADALHGCDFEQSTIHTSIAAIAMLFVLSCLGWYFCVYIVAIARSCDQRVLATSYALCKSSVSLVPDLHHLFQVIITTLCLCTNIDRTVPWSLLLPTAPCCLAISFSPGTNPHIPHSLPTHTVSDSKNWQKFLKL